MSAPLTASTAFTPESPHAARAYQVGGNRIAHSGLAKQPAGDGAIRHAGDRRAEARCPASRCSSNPYRTAHTTAGGVEHCCQSLDQSEPDQPAGNGAADGGRAARQDCKTRRGRKPQAQPQPAQPRYQAQAQYPTQSQYPGSVSAADGCADGWYAQHARQWRARPVPG